MCNLTTSVSEIDKIPITYNSGSQGFQVNYVETFSLSIHSLPVVIHCSLQHLKSQDVDCRILELVCSKDDLTSWFYQMVLGLHPVSLSEEHKWSCACSRQRQSKMNFSCSFFSSLYIYSLYISVTLVYFGFRTLLGYIRFLFAGWVTFNYLIFFKIDWCTYV